MLVVVGEEVVGAVTFALVEVRCGVPPLGGEVGGGGAVLPELQAGPSCWTGAILLLGAIASQAAPFVEPLAPASFCSTGHTPFTQCSTVSSKPIASSAVPVVAEACGRGVV